MDIFTGPGAVVASLDAPIGAVGLMQNVSNAEVLQQYMPLRNRAAHLTEFADSRSPSPTEKGLAAVKSQ